METNIVNPMHAKQRSKKQELIPIHDTTSTTTTVTIHPDGNVVVKEEE